MRKLIRPSIVTAASALALLLCPALRASTIITLTGNPSFGYEGILVGPYAATLHRDPNLLVFCLDLHIDTYVNREYRGSISQPDTQKEIEAAYLASYSLYLGAPSASLVKTVEGPISMAIWQIMGTLGNTPPDPAAAPFVEMAQSAYAGGQIPVEFLRNVMVWTPDKNVSSQRFITAFRDDSLFESDVPEPGTLVFLGSGVLLIAVSRALSKRRSARR